MDKRKILGFACAYTPLPLFDAAGFHHYRVLPMGDHPDQAGRLLHDNLCPHIKKILDRCLSGHLPDLWGMVFLNSCDAMRRLSDAWKAARPGEKSVIIELPVTADARSVEYFSQQLKELKKTLEEWGGIKFNEDDIYTSIEKFNRLHDMVSQLEEKARKNMLKGGFARMQSIYNKVMTENIDETIPLLEEMLSADEPRAKAGGVPVYLFGNILPDEEVFSLFESCGAAISGEDLCTGSRSLRKIDLSGNDSVFVKLSRGILSGPACARTFDTENPGKIAGELLKRAKASGARGIIAHTVKFCDPYLQRIPGIRGALKKNGMPFLFLEGDCTLRSIEQHRTRIEAFIEMLV